MFFNQSQLFDDSNIPSYVTQNHNYTEKQDMAIYN